METSRSLNKIAPAFKAAQQAFAVIYKTATHQPSQSKYPPLEEVLNVARPVLNEHDISIIQSPRYDEMQHVVILVTTLMHVSGQYLQDVLKMPVESPFDRDAVGASITQARRYALESMLGLIRGDDVSAVRTFVAARDQELAELGRELTLEEREQLRGMSLAQQVIHVRRLKAQTVEPPL